MNSYHESIERQERESWEAFHRARASKTEETRREVRTRTEAEAEAEDKAEDKERRR